MVKSMKREMLFNIAESCTYFAAASAGKRRIIEQLFYRRGGTWFSVDPVFDSVAQMWPLEISTFVCICPQKITSFGDLSSSAE